MQTLFQDLRYGARMMWKSPAFTLVAVLTLALGIGANTALFSVVDAVLLRKLPVQAPEELVLFEWDSGKSFRISGVRGTFIRDYYASGRRGASTFQPAVVNKMKEQAAQPDSPLRDLFVFANMGHFTIVADQQAETAESEVVSGTYFSGLGVSALRGRLLAPTDDIITAPPAAVISFDYWQTRFAGNENVIGKQVTINKNPYTIVGVTPPAFKGCGQVSEQPDVYLPLAFISQLEPDSGLLDRPDKPAYWWMQVMGRLKPDVTREQARLSLNNSFQAIALSLMPPPQKENQSKEVLPQDNPTLIARDGGRGMLEMRQVYSFTVYLLFAVVVLVLLIACANIANLMLARSAARQAEISIRLAVGAGRPRLLRQLLTESLMLSVLGGALGILFAFWGKDILAAISKSNVSFLPADMEYRMNWQVLLFTFGISLCTGVLFGIAPALHATKVDLTVALKESYRSSSGLTRSRLSKMLVVTQVVLSFVLLIGAGLAVRSLRNLQNVAVGFNQENLLNFALNPSANGYKEERLIELYDQIGKRLEALPGVKSATFASVPLLAHYMASDSVILPGETEQTNADHFTARQMVRENYFATMDIALLKGRAFTVQDDKIAPRVAIVSESFARKYFPGDDPIGKRVGFNKDSLGKIEIVGVAHDIKYNSQREDEQQLMYTPWQQDNEEINHMFFSLRMAGDPTAIVPAIRQAIRELDSNLPVIAVKTQIVQSIETLSQDKLFAQFLGFFGLLALLLAALGLYGVMSYSVAQRTNEIGIRMALGAEAKDVLQLIIRQGFTLVIFGLGVGAIFVFALHRIATSQSVERWKFVRQILQSERLYGIKPGDPITFALAALILIAVALLACWIPARRAATVDPMIALRRE